MGGHWRGEGHLWKMRCMKLHQPLPFHCALPKTPRFLFHYLRSGSRLISMTNSRPHALRIYLIKLMLFTKKKRKREEKEGEKREGRERGGGKGEKNREKSKERRKEGIGGKEEMRK